ncbi:hypothetical protein [Halodesulfovibrio marinisediminis]|uniref:Lipopolysaccharide kinase (Kdo/WaaP) family protein n=1 Tax=Halodesulfovibrio marinisediminis DSM 17456 TaxID=1121457 RepID=A0A1N6DJ29_9BACT|nr:hypothetical protein [Halodesulfovibrio marinisediminis]SIN70726.1 hypothetical protein SAMN02745161_0194 [Halodesulfovibrio marinisediminis DSM 17456]
MSRPDSPAITTLKNMAALFNGRSMSDGARVWRIAPHISDAFIEKLKAAWAEVRTNALPDEFHSKNKKREALNDISFTVDDIEIFPKIYTRNDYKHTLLHSFFFSEARRNFSTMCYLMQNNMPTTEPLALLSGDRLHPGTETVLFTRKLRDTDIYFYDFRDMLHDFTQEKRNAFFILFGKKMAELHNLGIYTEDTDKNISVRPNGDTYDLHFYDFDNFYPWRFVNLKRAKHAVLHSLFCTHYDANLEESEIFLESYLTVLQRPDLKETLLTAIKEKIAAGGSRQK